MSDTLVRVENVSKKFCRDLKRSLWYGMKDLGNELLGREHAGDGRLRPDEFWAVKGVSFDLKRGECLGLIGPNGAGKTTLLRMLNGLIKPDAGRIEMQGRVGALIALGAGFNPVLSGRENIFVNAAILGFTRTEIRRRIDDIVAFSGLGEFIEAPVQQYSSGMHVRLGFSIAANASPDILIVDEALSVGDAHFQQSSFERIRKLRDNGVAIIFVSHDVHAITAICNRVILLNRSEVVAEGRPEAVLNYYNALLADRVGQTIMQRRLEDGRVAVKSGTGAAIIEDITLLNDKGRLIDTINVGATVTLRIRVRSCTPIPQLILGYLIKDRLGQAVYGTNTYHLGRPLRNLCENASVEYRFTFVARLGPGSYSVSTALHGAATYTGDNFEWRDFALVFDVVNAGASNFVGVAWMPPSVECII